MKLYGFCIKGNKRLLVYEYLENGSLDHALFGMNFASCTSIIDKKFFLLEKVSNLTDSVCN